MRSTLFAAACLWTLASGASHAQTASQVAVAPARLMAIIGDGVFEMRPGKSLDLTKSQILMTFVREWNEEVFLKIAGTEHRMKVGDRLDLKHFGATTHQLQARDSCFLDLVEVVLPKGAPANATFRFSCI